MPPPLFILPPIIPVVPGSNLHLDPSGSMWYDGTVPEKFVLLPYDLDLYFQGFVQDPVYGFELTNGIRMAVVKSKYTADVAVARGDNSLKKIHVLGRILDDDAGDNEAVGPGLQNGVDIMPDVDVDISTYFTFEDDPMVMPDGAPVPSNNVYLSGQWPLVPGDAGIDDRFKYYPKMGSNIHIYARDSICRNNENENVPFIVVPVLDENGKKVKDLNVYAFRDKSTREYGFMVLDIENNDFYELKGTRKENTTGKPPLDWNLSPWSPYVAVSPDGKMMAAVLKDHSGDFINGVDDLYIIKLEKDETWYAGLHAQKAKLNSISNTKYVETRIFAETLTFAVSENSYHPYLLFFACNRYNKNRPINPEPPLEVPSVLWSLNAEKADTAQGNYRPHGMEPKAIPKTGGDKYFITYFGSPKNSQDPAGIHNELIWLRSEDCKTICFRAGGRYYDYLTGEAGEYVWEILTVTNIVNDKTFDVINATGFEEPASKAGWIMQPFGSATNGYAKASLNPSGTKIAFTDENLKIGIQMYEDLYVAPTDGSKHGVLKPLTSKPVFDGEFFNDPTTPLTGRGVLDPYFASDDDLLFFCGKDKNTTGTIPYGNAYMDLFLHRVSHGDIRNLTMTNGGGPNPPFTVFGDIRPAGMFSSRDGRYAFFFRGMTQVIPVAIISDLNLVGIDSMNNFALFDLTGSEFSGGFIDDIATERQFGTGGLPLGPESMSLIFVPAGGIDLVFFTAKYAGYHYNDRSHQVFGVNMDLPYAAFPLTSFHPVNEEGWIDNLVADDSGSYIAFSRSDSAIDGGLDDAGGYEKLYVADLNNGPFVRELTKGTPYDGFKAAAVDGSFRFVPSPSPLTPPSLVFGMGVGNEELPPGSGNIVEYPDNPQKARIWLYPLQYVAEPGYKETLSFPLTEEDLFLLLGALPY